MNIFYLSADVTRCAQMHNDKHCVKMILEYSQLLSTAHRVLDGVQYVDDSSGRKIKRWRLPNVENDRILYTATHINHPSAVWVRERYGNYIWLHSLLVRLCEEYTYRYGKMHKCASDGLVSKLTYVPRNIPMGVFAPPPPCMPEEYIVQGDCIGSYHNYYNGAKRHIASWKKRPVPYFIATDEDSMI